MPNKCNCNGAQNLGCGFIAVDSNWDLNGDWAERQVRRSRSCNSCQNDCDTCTRTRSACNTCENAEWQGNSCSDDCQCDDCTRRRSTGCDEGCAKHDKNRTVGMINIEVQELERMYEAESALRAGTLFPELHKPLNGYCPTEGGCGTCEQAAAFAAWELRLYLNTHPCDKKALALFRKLCKEEEEASYATAFLTDDCCMDDWDWTDSPWPWEYEANCCQRSGK